jgi:hypothetical protein
MVRHTRTSRVMHVHLTLFVFFFFFFFFSPLVVVTCMLSLFSSIYRRRVMTRKERGEDVYGCMLGQTLNDESSQKSNPINCTKERSKEKKTMGQ